MASRQARRTEEAEMSDIKQRLRDEDKDIVARRLGKEGLYAGNHGLTGLLTAKDFWEAQPYGTRLYYGGGATDYLHHSALSCAIQAIIKDAAEIERLEGELYAEQKHVAQLQTCVAELEAHVKVQAEACGQFAAERSIACDERDAARVEAEAMRRIIGSYHKGRCYACGWPLAAKKSEGCTPGDCSFRPSERDPQYSAWHQRMLEIDAAREGGK
jgi:hypothetical protein